MLRRRTYLGVLRKCDEHEMNIADEEEKGEEDDK